MHRGFLIVGLVWVCFQLPSTAQIGLAEDDSIIRLLDRLKQVVMAGDPEGFLSLIARQADVERAREFAVVSIEPGPTRVVTIERDRSTIRLSTGEEQRRLIVDLMIERGTRASLVTWRFDLVRQDATDGDPREWRIVDQERVTNVEGLYRLSLNPQKQFDANGLVIEAEDLKLRLESGSMFVAEADGVPTALVLRGQGRMIFSPAPEAERGQLRIFGGAETLDSPFDTAFIRIQPGEYDWRFSDAKLTPRKVDRNEFQRAQDLFDESILNSYALDLSELSPHTWSLLPGYGDFFADVHTGRFDTLTYARSGNDAEDITLFDRKRKRNISLYASQRRLDARGRFYDEDESTEYDVSDYDVEAAFQPSREWIEGRARLRLKVRSLALATLSLRLSQFLTVRAVHADRFGRILHLRVKGQDNLILNFPTTLQRGDELILTVAYGGRLEPQDIDREALVQQGRADDTITTIQAEPNFLYSNRSYWYPQSSVTDYATARMRLSVPPDYTVVASGVPAASGPTLIPGATPPARQFAFSASQPVRYLSVLISRFESSTSPSIVSISTDSTDGLGPALGSSEHLRAAQGVFYDSLDLNVTANPRQQSRAREAGERAARILRFYTALIDDFPYQSFTLALVENNLPGGHSPGYFAMLHQPLPSTPFVWRSDPVNFEGFPEFYLAHELAHQWWGQAVGWKNYHEQWLSEGLSQYFAALYAEKYRGRDVFEDVLRQIRRTAMSYSGQGPVYLGYRLGHIQRQSRIFRALVYNKGAGVLHMLRRLIGDEAFFRGLRRFYHSARFTKAGTEDLRRAFEIESGRSLERFFERWIFGASLPTVTFTYRTDSANVLARPAGEDAYGGEQARPEVVLRFEQSTEVFDVPVTVTLNYASGRSAEVVVPIVDRITEARIALAGPLRNVEINRDNGALMEVKR